MKAVSAMLLQAKLCILYISLYTETSTVLGSVLQVESLVGKGQVQVNLAPAVEKRVSDGYDANYPIEKKKRIAREVAVQNSIALPLTINPTPITLECDELPTPEIGIGTGDDDYRDGSRVTEAVEPALFTGSDEYTSGRTAVKKRWGALDDEQDRGFVRSVPTGDPTDRTRYRETVHVQADPGNTYENFIEAKPNDREDRSTVTARPYKYDANYAIEKKKRIAREVAVQNSIALPLTINPTPITPESEKLGTPEIHYDPITPSPGKLRTPGEDRDRRIATEDDDYRDGSQVTEAVEPALFTGSDTSGRTVVKKRLSEKVLRLLEMASNLVPGTGKPVNTSGIPIPSHTHAIWEGGLRFQLVPGEERWEAV